MERPSQLGPSVRFGRLRCKFARSNCDSTAPKTLLREQLFSTRYFPRITQDFPKGGGKC